MILSNQNILFEIDLPEDGYQETRFDWTGKITRLEWQGLPLTTSETEAGEQQLGKGLYNEFCMENLPGFEEAKLGEWCHKIGTGLLRKTGSVYHFQHPYDCRPALFSHQATENQLTIRCIGPEENGYSYELEKSIILHPNGLNLHYSLHNTGSKPIHTTEYTHNFLAFGQKRMMPGYSLQLPSPTTPEVFGEFVNPDDALQVNAQRISLKAPVSQPFFISNLCGLGQTEAKWTLLHDQVPVSLSEEVSMPASKVNLWGTSHVISPELFVEIQVAPGKTTTWTRQYRIHQTGGET